MVVFKKFFMKMHFLMMKDDKDFGNNADFDRLQKPEIPPIGWSILMLVSMFHSDSDLQV